MGLQLMLILFFQIRKFTPRSLAKRLVLSSSVMSCTYKMSFSYLIQPFLDMLVMSITQYPADYRCLSEIELREIFKPRLKKKVIRGEDGNKKIRKIEREM